MTRLKLNSKSYKWGLSDKMAECFEGKCWLHLRQWICWMVQAYGLTGSLRAGISLWGSACDYGTSERGTFCSAFWLKLHILCIPNEPSQRAVWINNLVNYFWSGEWVGIQFWLKDGGLQCVRAGTPVDDQGMYCLPQCCCITSWPWLLFLWFLSGATSMTLFKTSDCNKWT